MKPNRLTLILFLPILLLMACKETAKPLPEPDALGLRWGMTGPEVDAVYPKIEVFIRADREVVQRGTVLLAGGDWTLHTHEGFEGQGLGLIDIAFSDAAGVSEMWKEMKHLLTNKYGAPTTDIDQVIVEWETPRTVVSLNRTSDKDINLIYLARPGYADLDKL